ncbi:MAG: SRPBCC family protein [Spirochaetaceae bacterium]|nr:SRPBCC family protein [Myxococcales bacterium]MCB9725649.1 SRPBCC family protein [Spirochaetaceae bacterium]HPG25960.1 SRPBCC family protein [Myxococcota bacterium]
MAHFLATLDSPASAAATFAYLADFAHCAAWDPTVAAARRIGRGAIGEGSRFEVVLAAGPIELPFTYRVTRYEPPRRLVLEAAGRWLRSLDRIEIEPHGRGCRVRYDADLRWLGPAYLLDTPTHLLFQLSGRRSAHGLERALARLARDDEDSKAERGPRRRRPATKSRVRAGAA